MLIVRNIEQGQASLKPVSLSLAYQYQALKINVSIVKQLPEFVPIRAPNP